MVDFGKYAEAALCKSIKALGTWPQLKLKGA